MNARMQRAKERMINAIKNYIDERFNNMTVLESEATNTDEIMNEAIDYFNLNSDELFDISMYCEKRSAEVYEKYYVRFANFNDEHKQLLERMAKAMMRGFADTMSAEQYNDQDEWLQFIQKFECFTFQELQYINKLWSEEMKAKYKVRED